MEGDCCCSRVDLKYIFQPCSTSTSIHLRYCPNSKRYGNITRYSLQSFQCPVSPILVSEGHVRLETTTHFSPLHLCTRLVEYTRINHTIRWVTIEYDVMHRMYRNTVPGTRWSNCHPCAVLRSRGGECTVLGSGQWGQEADGAAFGICVGWMTLRIRVMESRRLRYCLYSTMVLGLLFVCGVGCVRCRYGEH